MSDQYWQDESEGDYFNSFKKEVEFFYKQWQKGKIKPRNYKNCPHKNVQDLDLRANLRYCPNCGRVI